MNDIEKRLREIPLAKPAAELVRRVDGVFAEAVYWPKPWYARSVPLWKAAAASVLLAVAALVAGMYAGPHALRPGGFNGTVCIIDASAASGTDAFGVTAPDSARAGKGKRVQTLWLGEGPGIVQVDTGT